MTRYTPACRLRRAADFRALQTAGDVFPGREAVVRRRANGLDHPRLGIAAPVRYGKAVRRNRFRRLVREAFRSLIDELGAFDYLVVPKRSLEEPTLEGLVHDLARTRTARPAPPRERTRR
ncbi:MAG: ribonuclease P protein component [Planctomycetota bacterium]